MTEPLIRELVEVIDITDKCETPYPSHTHTDWSSRRAPLWDKCEMPRGHLIPRCGTMKEFLDDMRRFPSTSPSVIPRLK